MVQEIVANIPVAVTSVVAIIAVYIAWQQHKTARDKVKLDLYDRRFKVYRGLVDLFGDVVQNMTLPPDALPRYYVTTNAKKFLFDDDVLGYMKEVTDKVIRLRHVKRQVEQAQRADNQDALETANEEEQELQSWFEHELEGLTDRFHKYLGFRNL